jgi:hypothetical protein
MTSIEISVIEAMRKRGGSFVKSLAETYTFADTENRERIKDAFPEYWMRYLKIALDAPDENQG